ncbi:(2Fe-2S)-binding protein [Kordiimonas sediminis]|uniref:(2Fe-2S)-binding protein n=1 Tax=Kordiimonas sediminis TaxID=1735581 RepID=A0A919AMI1_9PROT|nr:Rieske 2Fe-2S domain-containing protein [Kordiimonas sediminis]GHF13098.1 (2Fe-2S)-binding protein [Kordiimonas sediminis]
MDQPAPLYLSDTMTGPEAGTEILDLATLSDGDARELIFEEGRFQTRIFVQKIGTTVHVFENVCPHARAPLNLFGDKFLNLNGSAYLCRTHGAEFDLNSGLCTRGPCKGAYLRAVAVEEKDGKLYSL